MYICGLEYYSALKNDIMKSISKWMELEKPIILSKVFRTLKEKYVLYLFIIDISCKVNGKQVMTGNTTEVGYRIRD